MGWCVILFCMKNTYILILAGIIVFFVAGAIAYNMKKNAQNSTSDTEIFLPDGGAIEAQFVEATGSESVSLPDGVAIPDLSYALTFSATMTEDAKVSARKNIVSAREYLADHPESFDSWMTLGLYYKLIGDYKGAADAWTYASLLRPADSLTFSNLADLYAYFLKDPALAEKNFLLAIEKDRYTPYHYQRAYSFYTDVKKDPVKALAVVKDGIKWNPSSGELASLLREIKNQ